MFPVVLGSRQGAVQRKMSAAMTFKRLATRSNERRGYSLLNMHVGDFPQYILLFSAGVVAARTRCLQNLRLASGAYSLLAALTVGLGVWFLILRFRRKRKCLLYRMALAERCLCILGGL